LFTKLGFWGFGEQDVTERRAINPKTPNFDKFNLNMQEIYHSGFGSAAGSIAVSFSLFLLGLKAELVTMY